MVKKLLFIVFGLISWFTAVVADSNVTVVDPGLASTNAALTNISMVIISAVVLFLVYVLFKKTRNNPTFQAKLNAYGYDQAHFESLIMGAVMYGEKIVESEVKSAISKNTHSIDFLKSVDPELIDKYGDKVQELVKQKAQELGKEGWVDTNGDGIVDSPPPAPVEQK